MDSKKIIRYILIILAIAAFVGGSIYALNSMGADSMGEGGGH